MISDEVFVGSLALGLAVVALTISFGPWQRPYRTRSMAAISSKYGKPAARLAWFLIAVVAAASGFSILNEIRPAYAAPSSQEESLVTTDPSL